MTLDQTLTVRRFSQHLLLASLLMAGAPVAVAQELPKNFVLHDAPKPIASIVFGDNQGRSRSLIEFRDKVVLLNIWATWCGPCRREMPSLDRLQRMLGGPDFEVIALSIDHSGLEVVRKFYATVGIRDLAIYVDSFGKASRTLAVVGVPATLLVDRDGREIGRLIGPAEWDEPSVVQFLKRFVAGKDGSPAPINRADRAVGKTIRNAVPSVQQGAPR